MKNTLIYFIVITLLLTATSCNNSKNSEIPVGQQELGPDEELKELKRHLDYSFEFQTNIPPRFDFCSTKEATLEKGGYNRITGIANFSVPIPKGSNVKFVKKENDTLYFECNGHGKVTYGSSNLTLYNKTKTGLTRGDFNKKLWVTVEFKNFKDSDCTEMKLLNGKKKTSEVDGDPLTN